MPIHFEDRQAKYPNRWTMTKSDGTSEVVTLIRNDEPIVDGTPMNAETLNSLSDVAGADLARALAESARTEAQTAASNAASSAASAATSETNSATSEAAAKASAESAAASAELAGTRASTDKTLTIEDAPADAAAVRALVKELLAAQREEDYAKIKFFVSPDPTSPASIYGGTWERIEGRIIMGASDSYPVGTTGGSATHTQSVAEMPGHTHIVTAAYNYSWLVKTNNKFGETVTSNYHLELQSVAGYSEDTDRGYLGTAPTGGEQAMNILNPYLALYMWRRVEDAA